MLECVEEKTCFFVDKFKNDVVKQRERLISDMWGCV